MINELVFGNSEYRVPQKSIVKEREQCCINH